MSSPLRTALFAAVLACSFGCSFFQVDEEDLKIPPKKEEPAAAGKAAEAAAGTSAMNVGGMGGTTTGETGGQAPAAAGSGGTAGST